MGFEFDFALAVLNCWLLCSLSELCQRLGQVPRHPPKHPPTDLTWSRSFNKKRSLIIMRIIRIPIIKIIIVLLVGVVVVVVVVVVVAASAVAVAVII